MFRMMKFVGDCILVFGCVLLANGVRVIAEDPALGKNVEMLLRTGLLSGDVYLVTGGTMVFFALLIVGFGQLLYAVAHIAEGAKIP